MTTQSIFTNMKGRSCTLFLATVCFLQGSQSAPYHDGPPPPPEQEQGFIKRMGNNKEIATSSLWPNSASIWEGVPTNFGAGGNAWYQWNPTVESAKSFDKEPDVVERTAPYKHNGDHSHFGDHIQQKHSFSFDDINDAKHNSFSSGRPQFSNKNSKQPSFATPSFMPSSSFAQAPTYESYEPPKTYERPSRSSSPFGQSAFQELDRPNSVNNAFPTGFDQFKESVKNVPQVQSYGADEDNDEESRNAFKVPSNFGAGFSPSSSFGPHGQNFGQEAQEFEKEFGKNSQDFEKEELELGGKDFEQQDFGNHKNFHYGPSQSFGPPQNFGPNQNFGAQNGEEVFEDIDESERFFEEGPSSTEFTPSGFSGNHQRPQSSGSPFVQFNPNERDTTSHNPATSFQVSAELETPDPYSAPTPAQLGAEKDANYVQLGKNSHSYSSFGLQPGSKKNKRNKYRRNRPKYEDVKDLDNEYEEFKNEYETRDRGVNTDEKYNGKKGGAKKHKYTQVNYREPIQRIYDQKPEVETEDFGTDYGSLEAYSGGYSSEKFDPEQYQKDEMNNPDPGETEEEIKFNQEAEYGIPKENGKYPRERSFQQGQGGYFFDDEERDPDDNEEGYYVPVEAREENEDGDEEEGEEEIQGRESTESGPERRRPTRRNHGQRQKQYRPRMYRQQQQKDGNEAKPKMPYYDIVKEVEAEVEKNTGDLEGKNKGEMRMSRNYKRWRPSRRGQ